MRRLQYALLVSVFGILCALMFFSYRERIAFIGDPSAERAYTLGIRHLNSLDAAAYDIDEAEYFLQKSASLNPAYPYVHHQIARVYFLKGQYREALIAINREAENDPTHERAPVYYMRGLIEGYLGDYEAAVRDYKEYVRLVPDRWEGRTDYAWVLIKTRNFDEALRVVEEGLVLDAENSWLLSMKATILHEQGNSVDALAVARQAKDAVDRVTEAMWLVAYPGNSPDAAALGIQTLREAAAKNLEIIERAAGGQ